MFSEKKSFTLQKIIRTKYFLSMYKSTIIMLKRKIFVLLFVSGIYGQNLFSSTSQSSEIIASFMQMSHKQLFDTANHYFFKNSIDTALICYNILINTHIKNNDVDQQEQLMHSYNRAGMCISNMCDYRTAYQYFINALQISEKKLFLFAQPSIYNNIAKIYRRFNNTEMAKYYCLKALSLCQDSSVMIYLFNNMSTIELANDNIDSAFYYLGKSLQIGKIYDNVYLQGTFNALAKAYQKIELYDSAHYYYQLALEEAKKGKYIETEAVILYNIGNLFFALNKQDSALHYVERSNIIAKENNFISIQANNYRLLSKIEESRGRLKNSIYYNNIFVNLEDSLYNNKNLGDIFQLQRLYEVSKTNEEIEELIIDSQIKEHTIRYQKTIWFITLGILLLVSTGLLIISEFLTSATFVCYFIRKNLLSQGKPKCPTFMFFSFL